MVNLEVRQLCLNFSGVAALDAVSFDVESGQICGLIGPNGAGKTSLFNCLGRVYQPTSGAVSVDGVNLLAMRPHHVAKIGVARTFQNLGLIPELSVTENVMLGAHHRTKAGFFKAALGLPRVRREEMQTKAEAMEALDLLGLATYANDEVAALPYATAKRVEIARSLVARPRMLLLDEPAGGLTHAEVDSLAELILKLRDQLAMTILIVEHHLNLVMAISDKVVALNFGKKIADGAPREVRTHPEVVSAYLGDVS